MSRLDDAWFRDWLADPGGERAFLRELLKPPPRQRNWTTCADFKMHCQVRASRTALTRLSLMRLPEELAEWSAFVLWRVFTHACRFHPSFKIMLQDHLYSELLLYAESDYAQYREHIVHPYKVMAIGAWLMAQIHDLVPRIGGHLGSNPYVTELLARLRLGARALADERVIKTAWWLAGLFHDIGYTFYFMSRNLEPKVLRTYPVYVGSAGGRLGAGTPDHLAQMALFRDLWSGPGSDEDHQRRARAGGFLAESSTMNHSVVGGLTLLSMLSEMESVYRVTPEQALAFHLAADAIALHDLVGEGKMIHSELPSSHIGFGDRPLAWLLILCDELQDWGRPIPSFRRRGAQGVEATFEAPREFVHCDVAPPAVPEHLAEIRVDPRTFAKLTEIGDPTKGLAVSWSPPVTLEPA